MGMLGGNPSTQMAVLGSIFQSRYSNYMMSEALEGYSLDSAEAAYEDTWKQAPMGYVYAGGEFHYSENASHWAHQKEHSFTRSTYSENTN